MKRLICYSIWLPNSKRRDLLIAQLLVSLKTLRAHNRSIAVSIFAYDCAADLNRVVAPFEVTLHDQGAYVQRLSRLFPRGSDVLKENPLLHKMLNFSEICHVKPAQVLLLDCDTVFLGDVNLLFEKYSEADCYAREEPCCERSRLGYDQNYLDERRLFELAADERVNKILPFNTGTVLLNNALWEEPELSSRFLVYVWRLLIWMASNPAQGESLRYGEGLGAMALRGMLKTPAGRELRRQALEYPSQNRWIIDEVAFWLTLGHVEGFQQADFDPSDVIQNGEYISKSISSSDWILCHYFGNNMEDFDKWAGQFLQMDRY